MSNSARNELHVGDEGTVIRLKLYDGDDVVDISPAAELTKQLKFKKPSGTVVVEDAVFTTDGTDGQLQYVTEASPDNLLDEAGKWFVQAYIEFATGKWHSEKLNFLVRGVLA